MYSFIRSGEKQENAAESHSARQQQSLDRGIKFSPFIVAAIRQ